MNSDKDLGMDRPISRREFLHRTSLTTGGLAMAANAHSARMPADYPPSMTGLRGSHDGSFEAAHELAREGRTSWPAADKDPDAPYDLAVVGAGISGLSAAYFYRKANPEARILILDNHDDFGGHAKRNEFMVGGRHLIGYGGSQSLEAPGSYSEVAQTLLRELTVDPDVFDVAFDRDFYIRNGLTGGVYFDKATYGRDAFVPAPFLLNSGFIKLAAADASVAQAIAAMPLSEADRAQLLSLVTQSEDAFPDVGLGDLGEYLSSISYEQFLASRAGVNSATLQTLLRRATTGYFGVGTDAAPALEAMLFGLPGLNKTGIPAADWLARQAIRFTVEPYIYHYPDGNATVARLLARSLIPELCPARTAEGMVQGIVDYAQLDNADHNVRIRLNSTVLNVANEGSGVRVRYQEAGRMRESTAKHCVLACYNMMIPHLCPELPPEQKAALAELVKVPLVYSNVVLENWRAIKAAHMGFALTPSAFHAYCMVDFPVSFGAYRFPESADDPLVLHFSEALIAPGLTPREQHRIGRARLLGTPFDSIERDLRSTLGGMLGDHGFDPATDIGAITVNRWPHGYAYSYNRLFDPDYPPGSAPHEKGRRPFGNISIANSDAGARAYLDEAVDQAHRAVTELLA